MQQDPPKEVPMIDKPGRMHALIMFNQIYTAAVSCSTSWLEQCMFFFIHTCSYRSSHIEVCVGVYTLTKVGSCIYNNLLPLVWTLVFTCLKYIILLQHRTVNFDTITMIHEHCMCYILNTLLWALACSAGYNCITSHPYAVSLYMHDGNVTD